MGQGGGEWIFSLAASAIHWEATLGSKIGRHNWEATLGSNTAFGKHTWGAHFGSKFGKGNWDVKLKLGSKIRAPDPGGGSQGSNTRK